MTIATKSIDKMLFDKAAPLQLRRQMLLHLLSNESKDGDKIISSLLESYAAKNGKPAYEEKLKELQEMLDSLQEGPVRPGTFLQTIDEATAPGTKLVGRAEVLLPDGTTVFCVIADEKTVGPLRRGDGVLLDGQARSILARQPRRRQVGEEAKLVRRVDGHTVEVELDHQGMYVFHAAAELVDGLGDGSVEIGHNVIVSPQQRMALCGVPPEDGFSHYRFLDRDPIPDVVIERDIASPSPFIDTLIRHLQREMASPALSKEFRLHRCKTVFLTGVSGSGKTLNILGFLRRAYEEISAATGIPLEDLPPRTIRMRASTIVSKWYGESERHVDRLFDEVESASAEKILDADGVERELPVFVIAEEIDGLTRERGTSHDAVDDRVQTTILQRLDPSSQRFRESLVFFLCTSNVSSLLDPAFLRRVGGIVQHFGRLDRRVFEEILRKHVRGIPFVAAAGPEGRESIADITAWLFGPNADEGVVEITYAGTTQAVLKHRRDFLTGALVERAVQQASSIACEYHVAGRGDAGLSTELLAEALTEQVQNIVTQLTEHNANHYLDVPHGSRVASVRQLLTVNPIPAARLRTA